MSSARRKRLRGEREDRSCVQTREMRGQMDPSLKIPGAGGVWGQAVCQGRRELPGLGSLLLISSAMSFRAARQDRRGPCGLQPLPAHPSLWHVPPGGHPKGATASVPWAPSAPWWTQRTPTAMAATPPSSPGAGTPHPATGNWSSANTSLNRMGAFLTITAATDHGKKQKRWGNKKQVKTTDDLTLPTATTRLTFQRMNLLLSFQMFSPRPAHNPPRSPDRDHTAFWKNRSCL